LTKRNFFSEVLQSSVPVLVHFWAEWCGPCRTIAPVPNELADEYEYRVKIGRVNVDEQPELAVEYGIRAVPTLLLLRQGLVTDQIVGLRCKRDLADSFYQSDPIGSPSESGNTPEQSQTNPPGRIPVVTGMQRRVAAQNSA
jgi:thioredoxin 1